MTRFAHFRPFPLLLAGLVALTMAQRAQAETEPDQTIAPETVGGEKVVEIATGYSHSCARVESGRVWCWGDNFFGELGDGTTTQRLAPVRVSGLTGVTQIALGESYSCALRSTGRVFCWGYGGDGQLGNGSVVSINTTPVRVSGLTGVTQIALGFSHSCALRNTGRVFCWGSNGFGQLGAGTISQFSLTPVRVAGTWSTGATQIALGTFFSCLLRQSGRVACWGRNFSGELGDGTTNDRSIPGPVSFVSSVTQITAELSHSCALRSTGRVFCWGNNAGGQLGDGTTTNRPSPVRVQGLTQVTQMTAGGVVSCGLRSTGRVFCWGSNLYGRLGDGTDTNRPTPVRVNWLSNVAQVTSGRNHSCGFRPNGRAYCWGRNNRGQLGDGTTTDRWTAVRVAD